MGEPCVRRLQITLEEKMKGGMYSYGDCKFALDEIKGTVLNECAKKIPERAPNLGGCKANKDGMRRECASADDCCGAVGSDPAKPEFDICYSKNQEVYDGNRGWRGELTSKDIESNWTWYAIPELIDLGEKYLKLALAGARRGAKIDEKHREV